MSLSSLPAATRERILAGVWAEVKARRAAPPARLRTPYPGPQAAFVNSDAARIVIRAGRRGGKTVGVAILALRAFLAGRRVLYATPTQDQLDTFWHEVKLALEPQTDAGLLYKNETRHLIERPGTGNRIRAKTAWNSDTLRGDYADLLILDEYQLMSEDTWESVGAPMLLDNNGDAVFIYTPPSLRTSALSKARDKRHAAKLYAKADADTSGRWATFHFASMANPHISAAALAEISGDMTALTYEQEILALDRENVPGALWTMEMIENGRVPVAPPLARIVVAIDPSAGSQDSSDEAGIVVAGKDSRSEPHGYALADYTLRGTPSEWATRAICAYIIHDADRILGEGNNGGEMIETVLRSITRDAVAAELEKMGHGDKTAIAGARVPYAMVWASRSKATRAEPVSAQYEQGKVHHVGSLYELEAEMVSWVPGSGKSPNRVDAAVWAFADLLLGEPEARSHVSSYRK